MENKEENHESQPVQQTANREGFEQNQTGGDSNVNQQTNGSDNEQSNEKLVALLSYIGILFIIPMLVAKDSQFAQFHAKQGAALFVAEVITMFFTMIPVIGWIFGPIIWIVWFIFAIMGILNVINDKQKSLPILGGLAEKF